MSQQLICEMVNIYHYPSLDQTHQALVGRQITIGDLHANAIKLMFMLIRHGIASNIDEIEYSVLVMLYRMPITSLNQLMLAEFDRILSKIEFKSGALIRLIGDELADRGSNDYFTLKILEKLSQQQVAVEIILSNHGVEFIEAYECQEHFHAPMLSQGGHAPSMERLQILIDRGFVCRDEIFKLVEMHYKPSLRAISYSLTDDEKELTLYSHAAIGLNTIKSLAQKCAVIYQDDSSRALANTIDKINEYVLNHVQANRVHTLYSREKMYLGYRGNVDLSDAPFEFIMWNRFYDNIDTPTEHADFNINFVHGHDSNHWPQDHIYNLDNTLGKTETQNEGFYTVLYSDATSSLIEQNFESLSPIETVPTPVIITLPVLSSYFLSQLDEMKVKAAELRQRGHTQAADLSLDLCHILEQKHQSLSLGEIDIERFKTDCTDAIDRTRPVLEQYRGLKQILANVALAIVGLGVFYVMAALIHQSRSGHFLFFKTDSAQKIDKLAASLDEVRVLN